MQRTCFNYSNWQKSFKIYALFNFREVVLGEHTLGTDPDCEESDGLSFCAPKIIKRKVAKSILHEDWNPKTIENDIALLRLDQPVPLYSDDPKLSNVIPVCLPWNEFDPGRDIESWAEEPAIVTGKETIKELQRATLYYFDLSTIESSLLYRVSHIKMGKVIWL